MKRIAAIATGTVAVLAATTVGMAVAQATEPLITDSTIAAGPSKVKFVDSPESRKLQKKIEYRIEVRKQRRLQAKYTASYAQSYAKRYMAKHYGWGGDQHAALVQLWNHESGWDYTAENSSSGAYGIPQSLPGDKMASEGDDWRTNPEPQIRWGLKYIQSTYGTPAGALGHFQANNWY